MKSPSQPKINTNPRHSHKPNSRASLNGWPPLQTNTPNLYVSCSRSQSSKHCKRKSLLVLSQNNNQLSRESAIFSKNLNPSLQHSNRHLTSFDKLYKSIWLFRDRIRKIGSRSHSMGGRMDLCASSRAVSRARAILLWLRRRLRWRAWPTTLARFILMGRAFKETSYWLSGPT